MKNMQKIATQFVPNAEIRGIWQKHKILLKNLLT
jgi:hypothetical protein